MELVAANGVYNPIYLGCQELFSTRVLPAYPAAGRQVSHTSVRISAMENAMENYLLERRIAARSRNNGTRSFGHRSMMTPRMKATVSPRWRMELIITHLYGIMELLSRRRCRARGASLHAPWPGIRGSITMENGNGEARNCSRASGKRWFNGMFM